MRVTKLPLALQPTKKKRVAAYARVSDKTDNLLHSLAAQVSHYSAFIQANPDWEYVGVYADEGITGTSTDKRKDLQRLLEDCDEGMIDIVLVKSISRFARNTIDTLNMTRHLRDIGVEVRFERERISSLTGDGELLLTLLATFAEEESKSISANIRWAIRKNFEKGIPNSHKAPYGYSWDGEGYRLIPEQAEAVRYIFTRYLEGATPFIIRDELKAKGYFSQTGKEITDSTIKDILDNFSYTGDAILQKTYTDENHKVIRGQEILPRYRVVGMYEPIIDEDMFDKAQEIREARARAAKRPITYTRYSGKITCALCGHSMSRRTTPQGKKKWVCNTKERKHTCKAIDISESELDEMTQLYGSDVAHMSVFDEKVDILLTDGKTVAKRRIYAYNRRSPFSGKIICGLCGSPVNKETDAFRICKNARKHVCSLPRLMEDELKKATRATLGTKLPYDLIFAKEASKLIVYEDQLQYILKNGDTVTWTRKRS